MFLKSRSLTDYKMMQERVNIDSQWDLLATVSPKYFFSFMSLISSFSLIINTLSTISGRSAGFWPPPASSSMYWIPGHFALHVNVINRSGYPAQRHIAKASCKYCALFLLPPVKDEGTIILFPTCSVLVSPRSIASCNPL
ncbi:hypothetical protein ACQJBY_022138 [Aegilops geniculata]